MKLMDKAKQAALAAAVKTGLGYLEKDPEVNIPKLMELVDKFVPDGWYESQRNAIRNAIQNKDSNWYKLILRIYELDPGVREAFFTNFIINASLKGSALQEETAEENNCNVPWAILLDPTSACNLHCTGCWAAEYGHKLNLDFDTICSIVEQGRKMGTYMYIYTGGEPLVRKKDLMRICEKYPDCEFLSFTNGTLIDEEFCQEMLRVKNFAESHRLLHPGFWLFPADLLVHHHNATRARWLFHPLHVSSDRLEKISVCHSGFPGLWCKYVIPHRHRSP